MVNIYLSTNQGGKIREKIIAEVEIARRNSQEKLLVANIGTDEVILGMDWLQKHNPDIHWTKGVMTFWRGEQLQVATGTTWSQRIAEEQEKTRPKEEIPQEFQGFGKVFSEKESKRMPTWKPYDHAINLVPGSKLPRS